MQNKAVVRPNYFGKQKMVKAPKKWQSSPDHDPARISLYY